LAAVARVAVLTARMAQVAVALAKYCKQRFILTQQRTQLLSVLAVRHQQTKRVAMVLVQQSQHLH
jgi:hypothetical protein